MSDASSFDFSKFVPGFDFLKNLSGTGAQTGLPSASAWIAPTLDPDELDKRIQELKTVHFWLDQNTKAVSATIQALEVQKMTLATLRGMNMSMSDLADSLKVKPDTLSSVFTRHDTHSPASPAEAPAQTGPIPTEVPASKPKARPAKKPRTTASSAKAQAAAPTAMPASGGVDPMAWWGALTQQFQHIANQAVQDLQRQPPAPTGAGEPAKAASASRAGQRSAQSAPPSTGKGSSKRVGKKGTSPSSSSKSKPARKSAHSAARPHDA